MVYVKLPKCNRDLIMQMLSIYTADVHRKLTTQWSEIMNK